MAKSPVAARKGTLAERRGGERRHSTACREIRHAPQKARIAARPSCLKSQTLAVFVASKSRQGHCASRFFERQREDGGGFLA
ncbi:hypothetical protein NKI54_17690 [Mesorhizobium sp. M0663]|uniref:hypothetical protein n=1 Tax=Mesorhizobium sp. M0663 TaxID=2956981 RepID=UPI00333B8B8C